jgi:hypothetical protein
VCVASTAKACVDMGRQVPAEHPTDVADEVLLAIQPVAWL